MKSFIAWLKRLFGLKGTRGASIERYALNIGVEYSSKFGRCPGARHDSLQMRNLVKNEAKATCEYLSDTTATKAKVMDAMRRLIDKVPEDGMFIMTYSGHGGSQKFSDTKDEDDGKDEYLCLYDTYLRDNDIWNAVKKCQGKVFLIFDCCHSETMFRGVPFIPPQDLMKEDDICGAVSRDGNIPNSPVQMLVWSGCPDDTYSYGDSDGGLFTNAFLDALKHGKKTYEEIWNHIKNDKALSSYTQKPQQTILGGFPTSSNLWD